MVLKRAQEALAAPLPEKQSEARAASAGPPRSEFAPAWGLVLKMIEALLEDEKIASFWNEQLSQEVAYRAMDRMTEVARLALPEKPSERAASAGEGALRDEIVGLRAELASVREAWGQSIDNANRAWAAVAAAKGG